ncbi:glycosyltransferase 87 family protein [Rhodococcus sp. H29-C3]|uniref:glycosyltransferase 87 family protein n=1 Tax=Rhodococcus sp. H29-C3 TaxID=3046307 RepID=UPI0024BAB80B|nr:glycosyltransferase 87 family protein [Rhodococcus sp. H29-C3]MDJ0361547.1 glycosyltransferase 87 family protein [Rhodococcus sp. H29-C3]
MAVLDIGLLYVAVHLSWRQLGYENTTRLRLLSMFLAGAFTWLEPVRMTIWLGQINLLLLVLVLWDLGRPADSRLRGVGVGIAAGLKLTPALFIVLLAVVRDTRAFICASVTFVATIIVGFVVIPGDSWTYWAGTIVRSDRIGLISSPANQSIRGILARVLHTENPPMVLWIACAGVVAMGGLWAAHIAHSRGEHLLAITICGLTAPMISPFSWGHHWVWTVPLIVLTLHYAARIGTWWSAVLPVVLVLPLFAWYKTYPDGTVTIGIFMTHGIPVVRVAAQTAYPIVYLLMLTTAVVCLARRPVRSPI